MTTLLSSDCGNGRNRGADFRDRRLFLMNRDIPIKRSESNKFALMCGKLFSIVVILPILYWRVEWGKMLAAANPETLLLSC